ARVFLTTLSKDLVHGEWARERLQLLKEDAAASSDAEIRRLRSIMPQVDMVTESKEQMLLALVVANPKNHMAVEYLLAHYLLHVQAGKVACTISGLDESEHRTIAGHDAEAILLYTEAAKLLSSRNTDWQLDLGGRSIEQSAVERVREVIDMAHKHQTDKEELDRNLAARFPDSCFRYFLRGKPEGGR
ncbi:MAG: DUF6057 family protein, partial [Planctomycetota bacterium]